MALTGTIGSCTAGLLAAALLAVPAYAEDIGQPPSSAEHTSESGNVMPVVAPGEEIGIACNALEYTAPDNDVRVVLTISSAPSGPPPPGFKKVLATDEQLTPGAVHVRIPQLPDLADHTVNVQVFVVTATGSRNCDAGSMHIAKAAPKDGAG